MATAAEQYDRAINRHKSGQKSATATKVNLHFTRRRRRRIVQQMEMLLRAGIGDQLHGSRRAIRPTRLQRDVIARLLGFAPEQVVALFVMWDDGSD